MAIKLKRYNFTFLTDLYLEYFINPKSVEKLYIIYRIILIVLSIYSFINNNLTHLYDLLDSFNSYYLNQLHEDSFLNIKDNMSKRFSESAAQRSGGDNGPPGPNPNPFSGKEPMYEAENSRKREEDNKKRSGEPLSSEPSSKQPKPNGSNKEPSSGVKHNMQYYYDVESKLRVFPEHMHFNDRFEKHTHKRLRIYAYRNMVYTHDLRSSDPSKHFCLIKYSDGSTCTIYDIATMAKHIEYHKKL
jgi:hypothetical protein